MQRKIPGIGSYPLKCSLGTHLTPAIWFLDIQLNSCTAFTSIPRELVSGYLASPSRYKNYAPLWKTNRFLRAIGNDLQALSKDR